MKLLTLIVMALPLYGTLAFAEEVPTIGHCFVSGPELSKTIAIKMDNVFYQNTPERELSDQFVTLSNELKFRIFAHNGRLRLSLEDHSGNEKAEMSSAFPVVKVKSANDRKKAWAKLNLQFYRTTLVHSTIDRTQYTIDCAVNPIITSQGCMKDTFCFEM
jgi:hypothetical protein